MTQVGEGIYAAIIKAVSSKYLFAGVEDVRFESGIDTYEIDSGGAEQKIPSSGIHWGSTRTFSGVYVRQGGTGETKDLKVKVKWDQDGYDGSAKLKGKSQDGKIEIEGDFTISGNIGDVLVSCEMTTKPGVVANYGAGVVFTWEVSAAGDTEVAAGGSPLKLFFVDKKPEPIGWAYQKHYVQIVDWATKWAAGKTGEVAVRDAIWDKFSTGSAAQVPHVTGYSYWRTGNPVQNLVELLHPAKPANARGWSCRAIAHLFMECLAVNGIKCVEVIPNTPPRTMMFLVQNWNRSSAPTPNWHSYPDLYYGGSWISDSAPPLNKLSPTTLNKEPPATGAITIDIRKQSGVPAQGQTKAPLGFSNHWIVETGGQLYDSSYGAIHVNNIVSYSGGALAGWLVGAEPDGPARAWLCHELSQHTLLRVDGAKN